MIALAVCFEHIREFKIDAVFQNSYHWDSFYLTHGSESSMFGLNLSFTYFSALSLSSTLNAYFDRGAMRLSVKSNCKVRLQVTASTFAQNSRVFK